GRREHGHALLSHFGEAAADREPLLAAGRTVAQHASAQRREQRRVARQHAELALAARRHDRVRVGVDHRAAGSHDRETQTHWTPAFMRSPFSRASSTLPTMRKACSGTSSTLPSRISRKLLIVSGIVTYFPSTPVNCSATKFGWPRNFGMLRAA